jgi:hypothetical protein
MSSMLKSQQKEMPEYKWHATSFIKEKEEVKMMLERYSRKKEKKLEKKNKKKKEQSLKNEELRKKAVL